MKNVSIILMLIMGVFFAGCSNKSITIKAELPADVDALTKKRNIAVLPFKDDNVNFTSKLEASLASVVINDRPYFRVVNRDRIGAILKELKFQSSDLVGKKVVRFGKLVGAEVIITGKIKTTKNEGSYQKTFEKCGSWGKHRCLYYKTIYLTCKTSSVTFDASINAIDVNTARIIDADDISKNYSSDSCYGTLTPPNEALNYLADEAVREYIERIAPHYTYMSVELIEDVDSIDLNDKQEKMFENSLIYIEHGRLKRAEYILKKLNEETGEKSYEILYDLGVVEEALGKLEEAKAAYNLADKIIMDNAIEPNELVDKAIKRINKLIQKRKKLKGQI
jgi:curli biogenesis system outer membrane secretion channel CsgG